MRYFLFCAVLVAGCGKKTEDKPPAPSESKPSGAPTPAAAPPAGAKKWVALTTFGIEVEAPACAEETKISDTLASVSPQDPSCDIPFPGVAYQQDVPNAAATLDEELALVAADSEKPAVTRKDTTATGWVVEWKYPTESERQFGLIALHKIGAKTLMCNAAAKTASDLDKLRPLCLAIREKK
jgi:hypothetical protein